MEKTIYLNNVTTNYVITDEGRIFNSLTGKELLGTITQHGYRRVVLSVEGKKVSKYVHRLMAICFLEFDENSEKVINHIDGSKINNHIDNLEILSSSENLIHAYSNNFRESNFDKKCIAFDGNLENEEWVMVPDFPDYQVSSLGRVKSLKYHKPILLRQNIRCGYLSVVLSNEKGKKHFTVHDLVYFSFCETPKKSNHVIDHIDGNKLNNRLDNLRYISRQDNLNAALYEQNLTKTRKPVVAYKDGEKINVFSSIAEAGRVLKIDSSSISKVCKKIQHTAHGYYFEYLE